MASRKKDQPEKPDPDRRRMISQMQWAKWRHQACRPEAGAAGFWMITQAGKVTRQKYLEIMLDMDGKFPGAGWREAMDELELFYHNRGLALKDFPRMRVLAKPLGEVLGGEK